MLCERKPEQVINVNVLITAKIHGRQRDIRISLNGRQWLKLENLPRLSQFERKPMDKI